MCPSTIGKSSLTFFFFFLHYVSEINREIVLSAILIKPVITTSKCTHTAIIISVLRK